MGTTLRIGFAMGGGVSLGTFCGGALSQAIKLLLLYGEDWDTHEKFSRIEIDVFSGASAGAMSLAGMLRYLLNRSSSDESAARNTLNEEFTPEFINSLDEDVRKDLIAAQVVQDKQKELWSKEINLNALLANDKSSNLKKQAALLNRKAVENIAKRHLIDWENGINFDQRRLLADRILYACSLSNLTPVIHDASDEFPGHEAGYVGLGDGMRSHSHRELRVFDLYLSKFKKPKKNINPDRWCRYHDADEFDGIIGNLRLEKTWAKISATAIASGCFPFAFEPVILKRSAYEFGKVLWEKTFGEKPNYDKKEEYPFTYVDGGVFNNEPIRDAFRLASFIDSQIPDKEGNEFKRIIVFVDPFVSDPLPQFNVPVLQTRFLQDQNFMGSLDGYDLKTCNSLDRLIPHTGNLLSILTDECRVNEADKIYQIRKTFNLRDEIRSILNLTLTRDPQIDDLKKLIIFIKKNLKRSQEGEMLPPGPLTVKGELKRVIKEDLADNKQVFKEIEKDSPPSIKKLDPSLPHKDLWLRVLSFAAVDMILGLEGKMSKSKLVAIAPFKKLDRYIRNCEPFVLPGGYLAGFAGFMSDWNDEYEYEKAKYCAALFLKTCGLTNTDMPIPKHPPDGMSDEDNQKFEDNVQEGLNKLADRVFDMITGSHVFTIPGVLQSIGLFVEHKIKKMKWKPDNKIRCEFRIEVFSKDLELDGKGIGDIDCAAVRDPVSKQWQLITFADFDRVKNEWSGGYVQHGQFIVDVDEGDNFCSINLPGKDLVDIAQQQPQPVLTLKLKSEHRGRTLSGPSDWEVWKGFTALEETLLLD